MTGHLGRARIAALLASSCVLAAAPALAADRHISVPAQPLAAALTAWARQARVQIFFPTESIRGLRSPALEGTMADRVALDRLIAGSGLKVTSDDGRTVVLAREAPQTRTATQDPIITGDQGPGMGGDIVVTGIRASLQSSRETKRRSDAIVDVVTAEDIGQLPDNSATEALARLPGVQIFRNRGEGQAITVRGIAQVVTTVNGSEAYTGASRRTLLNSYPAGLIGSIKVYKALTPDLIEGGIGGAIDVQLRQPFDFKPGLTVAGTLRGSYDDQAKKPFYNGDLLVSGRWQTGIGEIGAMIDASYVRRDYLESYRESLQVQTTTATQSVAPAGLGAGLIYPTGILIKRPEGDYERPVITGELQWRPSANLAFKLRATNITDINHYSDNDLQTNIAAGTVLRNVVLVPGTKIVKSATFTAPVNSGPRSNYTRQLLDTTQIEFGADWTSGIATLATNAVYTLSRQNTDQQLFLLAFNKAPVINAAFQSDTDWGGLSYTYANVDLTNPDTFHVRAYSDERTRQKGKGLQWRTDLTLDTGEGFFRSIKVGVRYADRTATYRDGTSLADLNSLALPLSAFPGGGDPQIIQAGFGGDDAVVPANWVQYRSTLLGDPAALTTLNRYVLSLKGQGALFSDNDRPAYDPLKAFDGKEKSYAAYGEFKYGLPLGGIDIDGVFGARVVNTVLSIDGTQVTSSRAPATGSAYVVTNTAIHGRQNYLDVDPSASLVAHFTPRLQLRLAYTKTFSRPDFSQLNPSLNLTQSLAATGTLTANATTGNPDLKPIRSTNWDASLEYYYGRAGSFSVALFERDIDGFIVNTIDQETLPDALGLVNVTRPINAGKGTFRGVEGAASTFFDFAPGVLRNFGASATYTYIHPKQELPATPASLAFTGDATGISRNSVNASLFYDDGPFRAQVAYSVRDEFTLAYTLANRANDLKWYPISRLDASATYRFTPNVQLTIDGTNLLARPQRAYWSTKDVTDRVYFEGRVVSAALRFKF